MQRDAEGTALVDGSPPRAPPPFGYDPGSAFAPSQQLLVVPYRLDSRQGLRRDQLAGRPRLEPVPGAALAEPEPLAAGLGAGRAVLPGRRLDRSRLGL